MTMYEYLEGIYNNLLSYGVPLTAASFLKENTFANLISNDDKCLELIYMCYEFNDKLPLHNKNRASHIFINWLMGIGFDKAIPIENHEGFENVYFKQLWLQTAFTHDYGYFTNEMSIKNIDINYITRDYSLLDDEYENEHLSILNGISKEEENKHNFVYSYDLIRRYFDYSKTLHENAASNGGVELADHGIIGGCLAFRRYCKSALNPKSTVMPSPQITRIIKVSCYVTAAHNIFKSCDIKTDEKYKNNNLPELLSTSPIAITRKSKLLSLLSLVDTIECTKRFSKKEDGDNYLIQSTTLKRVNVEIIDNGIRLDYSPLYEYLIDVRKKEDMAKKLLWHISCIHELKKWTEYVTVRDKTDSLSIIIR